MKISAFLAASLLAATGTCAHAATATGSLAVGMTMLSTCTVTGDTQVIANLSNVGGAGSQTATLTLPIVCPMGTTLNVKIDYGANANGTQRRVHYNSNYINYDLYSDAAYTTPFPTGGVGVVASFGTITVPIFAKVPGGQAAVPPGTYTDTMQVTAEY